MTSWYCLNPACNECGEGDNWAQMDKAAERHTKTTQHGTVTRTVGSTRVRDGGRVRNVGGGS